MEKEGYHFCPIFNLEVEDGRCWEVCFADRGIKKEAILDLQEILAKHKISLEELQIKFDQHCMKFHCGL